MKDVFVLPEKWYIKITNENLSVINKWLGVHCFNLGNWSCVHWDKDASDIKNVPTHYTEITTDQFKRFVLGIKEEKEIVGWKLKDIEYLPALRTISTSWDETIWEHRGFNVLHNSGAYDRFKQAGVLDLWFEPVYKKEEPEYKVGDWVTHIGEWGESYDGIKTYKITKIDGEFVFVDWNACPTANDIKENFRRATPEEIKAAQTPQIIVNGYVGEFLDTYVKFGCAEFNKDIFIILYRQSTHPLEHTNRTIESVTIGKGTFTKEQIKEIAEFYLNK